MEYATSTDNVVLTAALSMTNVVPSTAIVREDETPKAGGGDVRIVGPYTGAADCVIDVEIVDEEIDGAPAVSAPKFAGVGNGVMTDVSAGAGMQAETYTFRLESLGTQTRFAECPFQGATLRAKVAGPSEITISVTSNLVLTDTEFALRDALAQDAEWLQGDQWNWGASVLTPSGDVPTTARRARIGQDPQVFRLISKWDPTPGVQRYVFGFSPRPPRAIAAGARVRLVTGNYTVTVTDPDSSFTKSYHGIALYDVLDAFRSDSACPFTVATPIVDDHKPGGQAATDLSVMTSSYCASIVGEGSDVVKRAEIGLVVGPNAPTETLSIISLGGSKFDVRGDVSGALAQAIAGVLYESDNYRFQIPAPNTDPAATGARIIVRLELQPRDGGSVPALCSYEVRPGVNLENAVYEFTWAALPPSPCPCDDITVDNSPPDDSCLGIESEEDTVEQISRARRVQRVASWQREFVQNNTTLYGGWENDIALVRRGADILLKGLKVLDGGTLDYPVWQASHEYKQDEVIEPSPRNGFRYAINTPGTSHTAQPTLPTTVGDTVTDGAGVVYECVGKKPLAMWDDGFKQLQLDAKHLYATHATPGAGAVVWTPGIATTHALPLLPTSSNGHYYAWVDGAAGGSNGATEPAWTTDGSTVTVGDFTYVDAGLFGGREDSTAYAADDVVYSAYHGALLCLTGGTTAAAPPSVAGLYVNDTFVDGSVTWKLVGRADGNLTTPVPDIFWARYNAIVNDVLAAAGIQGNFDDASNTDGCWQEVEGATSAFFYSGSDEPGYMPWWPNHWNVLAQEGTGGTITSSRKLAVLPRISCPENLVSGDKLKVIVDGVNGISGSGYQQGDGWRAQITHASPLALGGGQIGDDTLVWSVSGTESGRLRDYLLSTITPAPYNGGAAAWAPSTAYAAGAIVRPTTPNGLRYGGDIDGESGVAEPTWPTVVGDSVTADGITWTCLGPDTTITAQITPSGIPFVLGDEFGVVLEGGHARWRINGGAWSSPFVIAASVSLVDGLSAVFVGGEAPSWRTGDAWTHRAIATAGADNLRRPTGRSARWLGSTTIGIDPADDTPVTRLIITGHEIPEGAAIELWWSLDDWATTAGTLSVPWQPGDIHIAVVDPGPGARWRLSVDMDGAAFWVFLGSPYQPQIATGIPEVGLWEPEYRMPTPARAGGVGGQVTHSALTKVSANGLRERLAAACADDQRRFAAVPNDAEPEVHLVALSDAGVKVTDVLSYQPTSPSDRLLTVQLDLEPAA